MSISGENRSIWFEGDRLEKVSKLQDLYWKRTGIHPSRSQIINRAIDFLYAMEFDSPSSSTDERKKAAA